MKTLTKLGLYSVALGSIATAILDLWNYLRHILFDVPLTHYDFIGRWMLYMLEGQFYHPSIKQSAPIQGELIIGWMGHYTIGILFALILLAGWGLKWLNRPRLLPAMIVGLVTVAVPYFIMQPGMGQGIAGSLSPNPQNAILKVIISHVVFGFGLYFAGFIIKFAKPLLYKP
jgi:hypothetical protein